MLLLAAAAVVVVELALEAVLVVIDHPSLASLLVVGLQQNLQSQLQVDWHIRLLSVPEVLEESPHKILLAEMVVSLHLVA
jgi:hypothetical protein